MQVQKIVVGPLENNCYLVCDEESRTLAVIDPSSEAMAIERRIRKTGFEALYVINTHGHPDHICGNDHICKAFGARLAIHREDAAMLNAGPSDFFQLMAEYYSYKKPDIALEDGDELELGGLRLKAIHTPGHTRGGICVLCEKALFSGDTLFRESIGRTDLPGGDFDALVRSIKVKLLTLPPETVVYPGHGPETDIGHERKFNPFLGRSPRVSA